MVRRNWRRRSLRRGKPDDPFRTADEDALVQLAQEAKRRGVTNRDAQTLLDWAREHRVDPALDHINTTHWVGGPHIRVGPINHIPVR